MDSQFDRERGVTPARSHAELPLPVVPLPRPNTNPRPWDVEVEVRQFYKTTDAPGRLTLIPGTAADKIQVTYGLVNVTQPTLSGTNLSNDPPPELTISADTWVYIKDVCVFGSPDTHTLTIHTEASATPPTPALSVTGFTSYLLIGSVEFDSGAATITSNRIGGDLGVDSFGSINLWWAV